MYTFTHIPTLAHTHAHCGFSCFLFTASGLCSMYVVWRRDDLSPMTHYAHTCIYILHLINFATSSAPFHHKITNNAAVTLTLVTILKRHFNYNYSLIHSGYFCSASSNLLLLPTQRRSRHNTATVSEFHAEAPRATESEVLAQGPYVVARAGFEPCDPSGRKAPNLPMSHHSHHHHRHGPPTAWASRRAHWKNCTMVNPELGGLRYLR